MDVEFASASPDEPAVRALFDAFIREADGPLGIDLGAEIAAGPPAELAGPHGLLLLVRVDGRPAGLGGVRHLETDVAEVKSMYISPAHRGKGLGRRLLGELEGIARRHGCRAVRLDTSDYLTGAVALYRAAGYREVPAYNENAKANLWFERSLDSEPIAILPHDPGWSEIFATERVSLEAAIGDRIVGGVHHVGSTAVPGLDAKPIVDILIGVESLEVSRSCFEPLSRLQYLYAPYRSDEMHWFCKPDPARRTHHLHLIPVAHRRYEEELRFRDRLRADPVLAGEYSALKHDLASRFGDDRERYTDAKADFIRSALGQL
jgi:GrpB-like predicted nucleotidyltransferase (UPF0157 family)/GNAT superfamily N-acetyltransferase